MGFKITLNNKSMERLKLKKSLMLVKKVISTRNALPILDNILITPEYIRATNLTIDIIIRKHTGVTGNILINYKNLMQIINEFKSKSVEFIKKENDTIEIKCNGTTITTHADDPNEYPQMPEDEFKYVETLYPADLKNIERARVFTTTDDMRPVMQNVFIDNENIVATNATMLYTAAKTTNKSSTYYIDRDIVPLISKFGEVKVYIGSEKMKFEYDNIEIITNIQTDKFPSYREVLLKLDELRFKIEVSTERLKEICNVMKRYNTLSTFNFSDDVIKIVNIDINSDSEISTNLPYKGEIYKTEREPVQFNVNSLITCLKDISTTTLIMYFYKRNLSRLNDNVILTNTRETN